MHKNHSFIKIIKPDGPEISVGLFSAVSELGLATVFGNTVTVPIIKTKPNKHILNDESALVESKRRCKSHKRNVALYRAFTAAGVLGLGYFGLMSVNLYKKLPITRVNNRENLSTDYSMLFISVLSACSASWIIFSGNKLAKKSLAKLNRRESMTDQQKIASVNRSANTLSSTLTISII